MAQEYLPAPSNIRLADLMKEHNISQPELAKELGCSKSTISRFISGAKGTLTHEQVLKIARLFNVSTDFLLGETNIPDRKNYDIAELGLSVEAAKNLYTGRVNTEVVNLLLENARFAELTYRIAQYFDDKFASGIAAQNAMLTKLSTFLRSWDKSREAAKAAKDISLRRKPVYQGDLDDIEMYFMATVKEIKKGIGSHYAEQEAMSKKVAEKMFTELTKGQDVQHPTITAEQLTDAMLDSVSGMEGATPEALEQLRGGLLGILQSAAERENARFAELTYRIAQYFDDTFASGIAAQNAMLTTLSTLLRTRVKTPEAAKAAKDISLRRKPVYQGDLDDIEMYFMAAVKEIKKGIGSHYAEQEAMSKKVAEKMFTELTKGQDVQHPTITAEQLTDAMLDSVSGMEGATPEALEQLRNGLLGILQSAAEQENAHEADE